MDGFLLQAVIYLCAAVVAVPLSKRLGLGSVLGYLVAGVVIGPLTGLVGTETESLQHFAEFGVVMMLFLVGLELRPSVLWQMRARLFGLGGLQVVLTAALIFLGALALAQPWSVALAVGLILALSSTAIVLQTFGEKGLGASDGGRASFSVLLFQDIAVIPMLALIPLLALPQLAGGGGEHHGMSLVDGLPPWGYALAVLGAIAAVVLGGHFLSRPALRAVARSGLREMFTAAALLLVIGIALLMSVVGLSPALGTFLAGVVLADSEYRHELESDIEPFKGLLLGLFFITVGAGIDFAVMAADWLTIAGLTLALMLIKGLVVFALATLFRLRGAARWLCALSLAQAGEFGFVLLSFSVQNGVLAPALSKPLALVVALSMLLTPLLFIVYERLLLPRYEKSAGREPDAVDESGRVLIAGIGRFGQIVNRLLLANGVRTVVLDYASSQVDRLQKVGVKSYYGDASRPDLLHAAGVERAELLVVAIDDRDRAIELVAHVKRQYPQVKILARAFDRLHFYQLKKAGADAVVRETFNASLELAARALRELGEHPFRAEQIARAFRKHDEKTLTQLYDLWDQNPDLGSNEDYLRRFRQSAEGTEQAILSDREQFHNRDERSWMPPPKDDVGRGDD